MIPPVCFMISLYTSRFLLSTEEMDFLLSY
nr:MAG TPA: hypothetical protein [Caudoviricetes sp.]